MEWILTSERQPNKDGDYLVYDGDTGITVDTFYTQDGTEEYGFKTFAGWQGGRVTAWMPLPSPPYKVVKTIVETEKGINAKTFHSLDDLWDDLNA